MKFSMAMIGEADVMKFAYVSSNFEHCAIGLILVSNDWKKKKKEKTKQAHKTLYNLLV